MGVEIVPILYYNTNMKKIKFPESSMVEFKECRGKKSATLLKDLWISIAAFSNTHDGTIFLGVNDDGKIIGLDNKTLDKLQKDLSVLINDRNVVFSPR